MESLAVQWQLIMLEAAKEEREYAILSHPREDECRPAYGLHQ